MRIIVRRTAVTNRKGRIITENICRRRARITAENICRRRDRTTTEARIVRITCPMMHALTLFKFHSKILTGTETSAGE